MNVKRSSVHPTSRVHAECNTSLLHSAGGPYITLIAKKMDQDFAGAQLYRQRVCLFAPLCLLDLYQHDQCEFV